MKIKSVIIALPEVLREITPVDPALSAMKRFYEVRKGGVEIPLAAERRVICGLQAMCH